MYNSSGPRNPAHVVLTVLGLSDEEEMCVCVFISFARTWQVYRIERPHPPGHPVNNHRDQGSNKRDAVYIPLELNLPCSFRTHSCYEH